MFHVAEKLQTVVFFYHFPRMREFQKSKINNIINFKMLYPLSWPGRPKRISLISSRKHETSIYFLKMFLLSTHKKEELD